MNTHHLELFYHVVRCRGISAAARQMPYGIQQSTISAQIIQLEDQLGKVLFRRRPFELTEEGKLLFSHIEPFFGGMEALAERIRGGATAHLRIACPEIVQRDYLPRLLAAVRERLPGFHFSLESGRAGEVRESLRAGRVDVGLTTLGGETGAGIEERALLRMPLLLLVPADSKLRDAEEILGRDRIDLPLLALPAYEPSCRVFQTGLQERGVDWFPSLELAGLDLIERYVGEGFGVGLGLLLPGWQPPADVRVLPLEGFGAVCFGALTLGPATGAAVPFIEEAAAVVRVMTGG